MRRALEKPGGPWAGCPMVRGRATDLVPVDVAQAEVAGLAFRRYDKGLHPADLNFGDCFAHAPASTTGSPLLFKGGDFARTDIAPA